MLLANVPRPIARANQRLLRGRVCPRFAKPRRHVIGDAWQDLDQGDLAALFWDEPWPALAQSYRSDSRAEFPSLCWRGDSANRLPLAVELPVTSHGAEQVQRQANREQAGEILVVPGGRDLDDVETDDLAFGGDTCQEIGRLVIPESAER